MQTRDTQAFYLTSRECSLAFLALLSIVLLAVTPSAAAAQAAATATDLRSGTSLTEKLRSGNEREFQIFLNKGEVLEFEVVKGDFNVLVGVYDSGGQPLIEYVSHSYEPVELALVGAATGELLIKIRSLEFISRQGQFTLTVRPVRRATDDDVKNAGARFAIATASRLSSDWNKDSFKKAIDDYTKASAMTTEARIAAAALRKAAEAHFVLGEYRQALDRFEKAAVLSERAGTKHDALYASALAARLHSLLGNNGKAQGELNRLFSLYSARNLENETPVLTHAYAWALNSEGEVLYSTGDLLGAWATFKRAQKLFSETGDRNGKATGLLLAGHVANALGQTGDAMENFNQAYQLFGEMANRSGVGLSITAKGITRTHDQKDEEAIKLHREARTIFQNLWAPQNEAITLNAMGQAFQNLNEDELALDHYLLAEKLVRDSGTNDFLPGCFYQIAMLYKKINEPGTALKYFEDSARLSRANNKQRMEAYALNEIASIYAAQGKGKQALNQYFKVLRLHSRGDRRGRAVTLNNIGDLYLSSGRKREALAVYKQALPLSEASGERGIVMTTLYNITRAAREYGAIDEAKSYAERSIFEIEKLRTNVVSPDFRSSYFSGWRKYYDVYIDILWELNRQRPGQGFAEQALLASERSRARAFLELLAEAGADIRHGVDPALLKREKELRDLLAAHARYQLDTSGEPRREQTDVDQWLNALKAEYEEIQAQVRNQSPRYQSLAPPEPLTMAELQGQLGADDLLLEYVLGEERSYVWAVTRTSVSFHELKARSVIDAAGLEFYKILTARQQTITGANTYQSQVQDADKQYDEKARALSDLLLKPVAGVLAKKRLLLVTEGILQYIPFDALPHPADLHLIADHNVEIVFLPSVSALAAIRAEISRAAAPQRAVAVFADPVFSDLDDRVHGRPNTAVATSSPPPNQPASRGLAGVIDRGGLRRLTYSSDEADSISAAASGDAWVLKGFDASRENVMAAQIGQYQIVHFATHGFVNTERPELSAIVLTMVKPDGTPADGFLQLHDVLNLELSAELTVLSACETGLGKDVRGEGLIGLTRGLMFAGSRSVVASLWKVDDRATAVLMGHFYKALLHDGLPRAAALRYAKEQVRKNPAWSSPFFWAGFVLQGEYDKPIAPIAVAQRRPVSQLTIVLLTVAAISGGLLLLRRFYRAKRIV